MTLLEQELRKLSDERLRELTQHERVDLAEAAQAELGSRPGAACGEALLRAVFPSHPSL